MNENLIGNEKNIIFYEIKVISKNINASKLYEQIGFKDFEHKMIIQL